MSGHSKWHSIKHKKGIADAKRGKIFTRHTHLIAMAARQGGGDLSMNPNLRLAIDNAKADNVPNANIDRAIKKGTGELKEGAEIAEVTYEGYDPGGVALIVECLTDNKNRTVTNLRTLFSKNGGNMSASGSVSYLFDRKGVITVDGTGKDKEGLELAAIDAGAEDVGWDGELLLLYTDLKKLTEVKDGLKSNSVQNAEIRLIPKTTVRIEDPTMAKKVIGMMEAIEEDPDVSNVWSNFDIPENLLPAACLPVGMGRLVMEQN
ncbi:MAG: YebC/PmpR family DNA-binding transcriptional regulator [Candidatus Peregrinibacteria bacterium]